MTHKSVLDLRILVISLTLLVSGCQRDLEFSIESHTPEPYTSTHAFPESRHYLEPEIGEMAVRFDIETDEDLVAIGRRYDLNGYNVVLSPCISSSSEIEQSFSGLSILVAARGDEVCPFPSFVEKCRRPDSRTRHRYLPRDCALLVEKVWSRVRFGGLQETRHSDARLSPVSVAPR